MKAEVLALIERIRKVSRVVKLGCVLLAGILFLTYLPTQFSVSSGLYLLDVTAMLNIRVIVEVFFPVLNLIVKLKMIYHLYKLFTNYSFGDVFTTGSVAQIKQLGITFLLSAGLLILYGLPHQFGGGFHNFVSYIFRAFPFAYLICGGLLILISWVMQIGIQMREESDLTI